MKHCGIGESKIHGLQESDKCYSSDSNSGIIAPNRSLFVRTAPNDEIYIRTLQNVISLFTATDLIDQNNLYNPIRCVLSAHIAPFFSSSKMFVVVFLHSSSRAIDLNVKTLFMG